MAIFSMHVAAHAVSSLHPLVKRPQLAMSLACDERELLSISGKTQQTRYPNHRHVSQILGNKLASDERREAKVSQRRKKRVEKRMHDRCM